MPQTETEIHIRTVTKCPSCSSDVDGNYCQHCGEKLAGNQNDLSLKNFARDAYRELVDVDSKFLTTLKYLIIRPGFLTVEWLRGRRNVYLKPFRLYVSVVVLHFVVFALVPSGDMYDVDRFPAIKLSPILENAVKQKISTAESPVEFKGRLNEKLKDDLSIILYGLVFIIAACVKLLFPKSRRYYVEHLTFVFHIFAFAFVRNLFIIPLIMMDWTLAAIAFALVTQVIYTTMAIKVVYEETLTSAILKVLGVMVAVGVTFFLGLHVVVLVALEQVS